MATEDLEGRVGSEVFFLLFFLSVVGKIPPRFVRQIDEAYFI